MSSVANAIASAEGYGIPGAIPTLANNPGDLVLGNQGNGTLGNGITVFSTPQAGFNALNNQINLITSGQSSVYSPSETIAQIGNTWSGGDPNWANNVAAGLGTTPNSTLPSSSSSSLWSKVKSFLGSQNLNAAGLIASGITNGSLPTPATAMPVSASQIGTSSATWLPRGVAIALGMIFVAGGIFMFKSTQTIIQAAGTASKKAVEISA